MPNKINRKFVNRYVLNKPPINPENLKGMIKIFKTYGDKRFWE